MPDCGHTFCEFCVADILTGNPKLCPNCKQTVKTRDLEKFFKNQQLIQIMRAAAQKFGESQFMRDDEGIGGTMFTSCTRHLEKKVEYFCKTCSDTVCARCIFDEHNGHELV